MSKVRISKNSLKQFPAAVQTQIRALQDRFKVHSFSLSERCESKGLYLGEGDRYWVFYPEQATPVVVEMGAEFKLGASGMNWKIGEKVMLPGNTLVLTVGFLNGYYLSIETFVPVPVEVC